MMAPASIAAEVINVEEIASIDEEKVKKKKKTASSEDKKKEKSASIDAKKKSSSKAERGKREVSADTKKKRDASIDAQRKGAASKDAQVDVESFDDDVICVGDLSSTYNETRRRSKLNALARAKEKNDVEAIRKLERREDSGVVKTKSTSKTTSSTASKTALEGASTSGEPRSSGKEKSATQASRPERYEAVWQMPRIPKKPPTELGPLTSLVRTASVRDVSRGAIPRTQPAVTSPPERRRRPRIVYSDEEIEELEDPLVASERAQRELDDWCGKTNSPRTRRATTDETATKAPEFTKPQPPIASTSSVRPILKKARPCNSPVERSPVCAPPAVQPPLTPPPVRRSPADQASTARHVVPPPSVATTSSVTFAQRQVINASKLPLPPPRRWAENLSGPLPIRRVGMMMTVDTEVPTDPTVDPPLDSCYNCWEDGHDQKDCPYEKYKPFYCCNCGRRDVPLKRCPRCSVAHLAWKSRMYGGLPRPTTHHRGHWPAEFTAPQSSTSRSTSTATPAPVWRRLAPPVASVMPPTASLPSTSRPLPTASKPALPAAPTPPASSSSAKPPVSSVRPVQRLTESLAERDSRYVQVQRVQEPLRRPTETLGGPPPHHPRQDAWDVVGNTAPLPEFDPMLVGRVDQRPSSSSDQARACESRDSARATRQERSGEESPRRNRSNRRSRWEAAPVEIVENTVVMPGAQPPAPAAPSSAPYSAQESLAIIEAIGRLAPEAQAAAFANFFGSRPPPPP